MTSLNVTACGHVDSCNMEFVASIDFSCVGLWLRRLEPQTIHSTEIILSRWVNSHWEWIVPLIHPQSGKQTSSVIPVVNTRMRPVNKLTSCKRSRCSSKTRDSIVQHHDFLLFPPLTMEHLLSSPSPPPSNARRTTTAMHQYSHFPSCSPFIEWEMEAVKRSYITFPSCIFNFRYFKRHKNTPVDGWGLWPGGAAAFGVAEDQSRCQTIESTDQNFKNISARQFNRF